ncbi:MAG: glycerophosphodiester phosphodiesterase [Frankia sp.]|nr:glycerophosphodiester phosphodiesterase [Frankia sp.]
MRRRHEYLDHPDVIPFAHRGGVGPWPENSWSAFENAVRLGYRYLETDVRVTRDEVVMIMHDPALDRVADRTGALGELSAAEAARVRLRPPENAGGASAGDGEPIPRLDELLDRWPDVRFNLDVKEGQALEPTIEVLRRANAFGRVCVTSFDDAVAAEARRLAGEQLCVGAGMSAIVAARVRSFLHRSAGGWRARRSGEDAESARRRQRARQAVRALAARDVVQVPVSYRRVPVCDARFVRYMNAVGLPVHVWTVNDEDSMLALLCLGVHGLMTDHPELLRDVLRREGRWADS